ncbi:MAG: DUF1206 domain-containing protein [Cyanobacteria bacterium J06598_3]
MAILSSKTHQKIERWIEQYARIGYGAKGIVYGTAGLLALLQSLDLNEGEVVGSKGALSRIASQPFGRTMLVVLTISLIGYVLWRFIQAALDPEHAPSGQVALGQSTLGKTDVLRRFSYGCSGIAYAGVAYSAVKILTLQPESGGKTAEDWALMVMQAPFGRWLVAVGGTVFVGIGGYYFYRAIKAEFRKRLKLHHMGDTAKIWATIAGRLGIAARGTVYAVIGCYGIRAAWYFDPSMIKTTEDALALFDNNPSDEWILATLGIGFIAYGIHMGFQSVYRSIDPL